MKRQFDLELEELRGAVLGMGGLCEEMLRRAMRVVAGRDERATAELLAMEERVNRLHIEIDERCLKLLALHQPAATDLRLIAACLKINSDLERVGDQAVNIGETGRFLLEQAPIPLGDLPRMVELAATMLQDSLDAFSRREVALARSVIARDDEEDRLKGRVFDELLKRMKADPAAIQGGMESILIARNLERIADHATNIAEDVIFMVQARDIRHHSEGSGGQSAQTAA
ncbi:MAG: phosphate signaling complex protein PhoU [Elusimicrobia bacterium]|nr:phosphate signaling complex protein PhoU [Elusimicrobiota bacterium]